MYTIKLSYLKKAHSFFKETAPEIASTNIDGISESEKQRIMQAVEDALAKSQEHDPKHEALKLAMQSSLDPVLNDPKKVLQMIEYAQEHGKSALTVLAISKRFATLIGDTGYFAELSTLEQHLVADKSTLLTKDHAGINAIKDTIKQRIITHLPDSKKTA